MMKIAALALVFLPAACASTATSQGPSTPDESRAGIELVLVDGDATQPSFPARLTEAKTPEQIARYRADGENLAQQLEVLKARRELKPGDIDGVTYDERAGWLAVRRGEHTLLANFARIPVHVPRERPEEIVLATHATTQEPGFIVLPALSGALVR